MKKFLALFLSLVLVISCLQSQGKAQENLLADNLDAEFVAGIKGLNDPSLPRYLEDSLYISLVETLNSDDYFVENVQAIYISQEYLDELAYNSQMNVFFGYTLSELEQEFQSSKFIFTLGEDGTTVVEPFEEITDETYSKVFRNIAIGTGVILVCVTVSVVSAGVGAPAISLIFAASAKTGATMALSGAAMGAASAGIITGIQTNNIESALKAAALAGSEGFKWGAISGAVSGGASKLISLKGSTLGGLTMNEAALIQRESNYPVHVIKQFSSMEQYEIFKHAGLSPHVINGKTALIRKIDLDFIDESGQTNRARMKLGRPALDPASGREFDLHHVDQRMESTLAILTLGEHKSNGNFNILHPKSGPSQIDRSVFHREREDFWKTLIRLIENGGVNL